MIPLLAHAGPGSTWQAAVVVAAIALAICVGLAVAGRLPMHEPADLLVPLAGSAILASLGPLAQTWLSDAVGWAIPLGAVAILALVLAALTPLDLTPTAPLTLGAATLAAVSIFMLYQPLTAALHPPVDMLPLRDDSEVAVLAPEDDRTVEAGEIAVEVEVTGGSIGPVVSDPQDLPSDPEEAGSLAVYVDGDRVDVAWDGCTVADPCSRIDLRVPVAAGERTIAVEFVRGDGTPFAPTVIDRVTLDVE